LNKGCNTPQKSPTSQSPHQKVNFHLRL